MNREPLTLTLAFRPSKALTKRIKSRLPENVSLKIRVDHQIIGGAIISFKGKYWNFSLSKRFPLREAASSAAPGAK